MATRFSPAEQIPKKISQFPELRFKSPWLCLPSALDTDEPLMMHLGIVDGIVKPAKVSELAQRRPALDQSGLILLQLQPAETGVDRATPLKWIRLRRWRAETGWRGNYPAGLILIGLDEGQPRGL
ncbi:MAG TPA: hypothetical protein VK281_08890, partial [Xanthobacteraceae bacterium]|nr:hypothetical protein [Xanthobacteraceae bacterium]